MLEGRTRSYGWLTVLSQTPRADVTAILQQWRCYRTEPDRRSAFVNQLATRLLKHGNTAFHRGGRGRTHGGSIACDGVDTATWEAAVEDVEVWAKPHEMSGSNGATTSREKTEFHGVIDVVCSPSMLLSHDVDGCSPSTLLPHDVEAATP
jgi:hypothetical protein